MESCPSTTCSVGIGAWSSLTADAAAIAAWRKQPIVIGTATKPASLLKHADDQTVVALRAVINAMERVGWQAHFFADWAILVGGSFFGRGATAEAMRRFRAEGAWAVSPHVIPNHSLHAPSGTLSHLLGVHGPNFGVGSSADTTADALLLAMTLLSEGILPGVWVVLTHCEPEWIPLTDGTATSSTCRAVALALTAARSEPLLTIGPADERLPALDVGAFANGLNQGSGRWRLSASLGIALHTSEGARP